MKAAHARLLIQTKPPVHMCMFYVRLHMWVCYCALNKLGFCCAVNVRMKYVGPPLPDVYLAGFTTKEFGHLSPSGQDKSLF